MAKLADTNEKIAEKVVGGYKTMETGIVGSYMKMQTTIVDNAVKVMDKCTEALFSKEGETLEETKDRLRK